MEYCVSLSSNYLLRVRPICLVAVHVVLIVYIWVLNMGECLFGGMIRGRKDAYTLTNFWEQTVLTRGRKMKNSLVFCPSFAFTTPRLCLCIRRNYLGPSIIFPFPQPLSTHACADLGFLYPRWCSWYLQSHSSSKTFLTFRITSPFYF